MYTDQRPQTIIEKKVYEENGNSRGDYNRTTRERANAGLTLGVIGTVLGGAATLFNRNGGGLLSGLTSVVGGGSTPGNVNINTYGGGQGGYNRCSPSPFEAWEKGCEDALALTNTIWRLRVDDLTNAKQAREVDVAEKFQLYKSQIESDFALYKDNRDNIDRVNNRINTEMFDQYKYTRDKDDEIRKELSELKARVAANEAIRPYQDKLIQCEIDKAFTAGINYVDRRMCRVVEGQVVLPNDPVVTGYAGATCCFRPQTAAAGGGAAA